MIFKTIVGFILLFTITGQACDICNIQIKCKKGIPSDFWDGYNYSNTRRFIFGKTEFVKSPTYCAAISGAYDQVPTGAVIVETTGGGSNKNGYSIRLGWVIKKGYEVYGKK